MSIIRAIDRIRSTYRQQRQTREAILEMDGFPPTLQRDIGWPTSRFAQAGSAVAPAFWATRS